MMMVLTHNVSHVLTNVLIVLLLIPVLNVVVTDTSMVTNVLVKPETTNLLNVNVQHVTINVLNVPLLKNVPFVPLTESKKTNQLAHVQSEPITKKDKLNAQPVLTNVVLVLISLLVPLVVNIESTLQPVTVKKDIMNKPKLVTLVTTNVKLVKPTKTIVLPVKKEELVPQLVTAQKVNTN
jgi:hypothetical protein